MRKIKSITIDGNNNITITEVENSQITVNTILWEDFTQKYTREQHERVQELQKLLQRTERVFEYERLELSTTINTLQTQIEEKEKQIRSIIQYYEYIDISTTSVLYQQALHCFMNGELDAALEMLEEVTLDEQERQQAENRILKAHILQLQYRFDEAEKNLLRAVQIYPSWENYLALANYYAVQRNFTEAVSFYQKCLSLAVSDEQRAITLNNLGTVQSDIRDYTSAIASYEEALGIYCELHSVNPQMYAAYMAMVLSNMGSSQRYMEMYDLALKSYKASLDIYCGLHSVNPQMYAADMARILNNIGLVQHDMGACDLALESLTRSCNIYRELYTINPQVSAEGMVTTLVNMGTAQHYMQLHDLALKSYTMALDIYDALYTANPQAYAADMAMALSNKGLVQGAMQLYDLALESLTRSCNIYRELCSVNPQVSAVGVATMLNNIGTVQLYMQLYDLALKSYEESLAIYRELLSVSSQVNVVDMARLLHNMGLIQNEKQEYDLSLKSYEEALKIRRKLYANKPQVYIADIVITQINMGLLYLEGIPDKEQSLSLLHEALTVLLPVRALPFVEQYCSVVEEILQRWEVDVEQFFAEAGWK